MQHIVTNSILAAAELGAQAIVNALVEDGLPCAVVELSGKSARWYVTLPGFTICEGNEQLPQLHRPTLEAHAFASIGTGLSTVQRNAWMRDCPVAVVVYPANQDGPDPDTAHHVHTDFVVGFNDLGAALVWAARWDDPVILDTAPENGDIVGEVAVASATREQAALASEYIRDVCGHGCIRTALAAREADLGIEAPEGADSRLAALLHKAH